MAQQLKRWQGWLLFGGSMVIVFILGLVVSSLLERRAEVVSIYNNRKNLFKDSIVSQNELFAEDFPREYQTWAKTADTTYQGEFNSSQRVPRWSSSGLAIPSRWSIILHADTSTLSKICARSFALVLLG